MSVLGCYTNELTRSDRIMLYEKVQDALNYLKNRTENYQAYFGIILGTGLSELAKEIEVAYEIPYAEIPNFPVSTVESHAGKLIFGTLEGIPIVAMAGRFHYYEGYSTQEATLPVRVFKMLGIKRLIISSAVGSVNPNIEAGDVVVLEDHINMIPDHPLRGPNDERLGVRFPDMKDAYDKALNEKVLAMAKAKGIRASKGVYLALQGPNLETPAEYRMANIIGADVIGMSTVPEVIVAKHMELPILATSVVSNKCFPIEEIQETTLEDVLAVVETAAPKLTALIKAVLKDLYES
jgi:purine-nucleoside phosphorylase